MRFSSLTEADIKYLLPEGTSDKMLHFLSQAYRKLTAGERGGARCGAITICATP